MDSLVFDTVVGVVFIFAVFALAVSAVTEGIARYLALRAEFLLRGLSSLLNSDTTFGKGWLVDVVATAAKDQREASKNAVEELEDELDGDRAGLAHSELSGARSTVDALMKQDSPDPAGTESRTASDQLEAARAVLAAERTDIAALPDGDSGRADRVKALATAQVRLATLQRALSDALTPTGAALSAASLLAQPIVDLTEALRVPDLSNARLERADKRALPSYMSSRTFSRALMNLLVPKPIGGQTTVGQLKASIETIADPRLRNVLSSHLDTADRSVEAFRLEVERWYDTHMERVSGWYKRHTRKITLGIAAVLAVLFNVNAVSMTQALYSDQALRESVVALAFENADCTAEESGGSASATDGEEDDAGKTPEECLSAVRGEIGGLRGAGLPVGWSEVPECAVPDAGCSWLDRRGVTVPGDTPWDDSQRVIVVLIGWALMMFAAFLGARFWFDALSRLNTLRSAGKKPAATV